MNKHKFLQHIVAATIFFACSPTLASHASLWHHVTSRVHDVQMCSRRHPKWSTALLTATPHFVASAVNTKNWWAPAAAGIALSLLGHRLRKPVPEAENDQITQPLIQSQYAFQNYLRYAVASAGLSIPCTLARYYGPTIAKKYFEYTPLPKMTLGIIALASGIGLYEYYGSSYVDDDNSSNDIPGLYDTSSTGVDSQAAQQSLIDQQQPSPTTPPKQLSTQAQEELKEKHATTELTLHGGLIKTTYRNQTLVKTTCVKSGIYCDAQGNIQAPDSYTLFSTSNHQSVLTNHERWYMVRDKIYGENQPPSIGELALLYQLSYYPKRTYYGIDHEIRENQLRLFGSKQEATNFGAGYALFFPNTATYHPQKNNITGKWELTIFHNQG